MKSNTRTPAASRSAPAPRRRRDAHPKALATPTPATRSGASNAEARAAEGRRIPTMDLVESSRSCCWGHRDSRSGHLARALRRAGRPRPA
eukprot:361323-Chlamydomonas_euryale.AAC.8